MVVEASGLRDALIEKLGVLRAIYPKMSINYLTIGGVCGKIK